MNFLESFLAMKMTLKERTGSVLIDEPAADRIDKPVADHHSNHSAVVVDVDIAEVIKPNACHSVDCDEGVTVVVVPEVVAAAKIK